MNISFPDNYLSSDRQNYANNLKKIEETGSGRKQIPSNHITAETGADKAENDRLLRKMQLSQTKAEVLGHYLGAMQTAARESGSNGVLMMRRVGHLTATQKAFQETEQYKKMKEQDTFFLDQMEALQKRQEEMEELRETQTENQVDAASQPEEDMRQPAVAGEVSGSGTRESMQKHSVSGTQNADMQKKAAISYKTKDAPARNPSVQGVFNGTI